MPLPRSRAVHAWPLAGTKDVQVWKTWSFGAASGVSNMYGVGSTPTERGVVSWRTHYTTVDYPPATLYGLALVGRAYRTYDPDFNDSVVLSFANLAVFAWHAWRFRLVSTPGLKTRPTGVPTSYL